MFFCIASLRASVIGQVLNGTHCVVDLKRWKVVHNNGNHNVITTKTKFYCATQEILNTSPTPFNWCSINPVHPDLSESYLGHKVSLKNVTALIFKCSSPFKRLADSPPKSSGEQGKKREEGTVQTSVYIHLVH